MKRIVAVAAGLLALTACTPGSTHHTVHHHHSTTRHHTVVRRTARPGLRKY